MYSYENPLGFTRDTASLLTGLGCSNLSEFKKRDIGLDDLRYLTDEDLAILDVGENFDFVSFKKLSSSLIKKHGLTTKPNAADVFKILGAVKRQLQVIHMYCRCINKLSPSLTDYFLEKDTNLKVSTALIDATDCVIDEIKTLQTTIDELQPEEKPECINNNVKSNIKLYSLIGGIGVGVIATIVYIYY